MKKALFTMLLAACSLGMQAQFSGQGSGTEKDPYQITNADQLFEIRNDMSAYYKMMNDIDLTDWIKEESPTQGWTPIGNTSAGFKGSFDGGNHTIKGLFINRPNMDNVGLFGLITSGSIRNVVVESAYVLGGNSVGTIVGGDAGSTTITINNCHVIAPKVMGAKDVGGILGCGYLYSSNISISNCSCIGGKIQGNQFVGGLVGRFAADLWDKNGSYDNYIQYNYTSCDVQSPEDGLSGGIVGDLRTYANRAIYVNDNISETICLGAEKFGGILGNGDNPCGYMHITHNTFSGKIKINKYVYGIMNLGKRSTYSYTQHFCMSDTLYSSSDYVYRIGNDAGANNYACNGTVIYKNGKLTTVEDSNEQGIGYGLRTLKRESTYVGAGFDFTNTWTIKEGETFPYLKAQVAPVTVTSFAAGNKATIKGTATEGTTVYVIIGDNMYESYILDGQWEVSLGRIDAGTEAKVYAMSKGKMPSTSTKAIAESGQPTPEGKPGDANGDGVVDSADVTAIINYILGKPGASFNKDNADVTGDGEILIDDAV